MTNDTNKGRLALVEWIQATGISQNEISRRTGLPQATISRWTRGEHRPGLRMALVLEDFTFGKVRAADWVVDR